MIKNRADVTKPLLVIIKIDQTGHMRLPDRWQSDAAAGMSARIGAVKIGAPRFVAGGSKRLAAALSSANPVWFVS